MSWWRSGDRLDFDCERATTDRPLARLTATKEEDDEEGCWLPLWLMNYRKKGSRMHKELMNLISICVPLFSVKMIP